MSLNYPSEGGPGAPRVQASDGELLVPRLFSKFAMASSCYRGSLRPDATSSFIALHGVRLQPRASDPPSLGTVRGSEARCVQTCAAVPGCNAIVREPGSDTCSLSSVCVAPEWSRIREMARCTDGALSLIASSCRPEPKWVTLDYRITKGVGEVLHDILAPGGVEQCKELCRLTAGCNQVAVSRTNGRKMATQCQLMAGCAKDAAGRGAGSLGSKVLGLLKTRSSGFYSVYMEPCTAEAAFPTDGAPAEGPHRQLLPAQRLPSGLLSMDCRDPAPRDPARRGRMPGGGAAGKRAGPRCSGLVGPSAPRRPTLPELRWPAHYTAARTAFLRAAPAPATAAAPAAAAAATGAAGGPAGGATGCPAHACGGACQSTPCAAGQGTWFGRDVSSPSNASLQLPHSTAEARRTAPPLLARLAAAVAARSFNGEEIIL